MRLAWSLENLCEPISFITNDGGCVKLKYTLHIFTRYLLDYRLSILGVRRAH